MISIRRTPEDCTTLQQVTLNHPCLFTNYNQKNVLRFQRTTLLLPSFC